LKVESTNPSEAELDISPLQSAFILLDQKKMMINSYAEGKRTSEVRWELQLRARKSGYVEVPVLTHNAERSDGFSIFVKSSSRARFLPVSDMPIILDAQLNREDNYEKALFIYTLNLYSDQPLAANYSLSPPKIEKAKVILLDSSEIQEIEIRGKQYQLQEQRYAIFPTEMGRYVIEGPVFNGSQQGSNQIEARANNLEINVHAGQDFDNAKYWLPAQKVTVSESWQKNQQLLVGDFIEREITFQVQGMSAANIPDIEIPTPRIVKIISSDTTLSDKIDNKGVQGTKVIKQKIQLLERGELTFERVAVYWWDTQQDSQKITAIAKQILNVLPGLNGESSIEREIAQNQNNTQKRGDITVIATDGSWLIWALITLTLLTSIGWLFNLRKLKRIKDSQAEAFNKNLAKQKKQSSQPGETARAEAKSTISFNAKAELNTFQLLGRVCLKDDLLSVNRRLLEWANQYWYQQEFKELSDIAMIADNQKLTQVLSDMQVLLDNHDVAKWQGEELYNLLSTIREQ